MKKIFNQFTLMFCFLLFGIILVRPVNVSAVTPAVVNLPDGEDKSFNKYDITGDGSKDTIRVYYGYAPEANPEDDPEYQGIVTLNGKTALTFRVDEEYNFYNAKLIVLKNGAKFLYLKSDVIEDSASYGIYKYSGGSFRKILNLNAYYGNDKYGDNLAITSLKVSGNTLKVYARQSSYTTGLTNSKFEYVYSKGTLKKKPSTGWITKITQKKSGKLVSSRTLVVNKKLTAYTTSTGKKKAFVLKKNNKVYVDRIYYSSKYGMRIRVKYKKKYGWIKCSTKSKNGYFKYIYMG